MYYLLDILEIKQHTSSLLLLQDCSGVLSSGEACADASCLLCGSNSSAPSSSWFHKAGDDTTAFEMEVQLPRSSVYLTGAYSYGPSLHME